MRDHFEQTAVASGEAEARMTGISLEGKMRAACRHLCSWIAVVLSAAVVIRVATGQAAVQISKQAAIRDALRDAPWRHASATGSSLVRYAHRLHTVPAGTLGWLASVKPQKPVYDATKTDRGHAANYYVVVIRASDGVLLAAVDGYRPALANRSGRGGWATGEFI